MNTTHSGSKPAAHLWERMLGSVATRIHNRSEEAKRRREMAELHALPPHVLRDIGYYD